MKTSIESSALRRGRRSIAGQCYLLTTATARRHPWFADTTIAACAVDVLNDSAAWPSARPWLWILMPDHLHLLVELNGSEPLARIMAMIKGLIRLRVSPASLNPPAQFWQPSFHDRALRREENLLGVGRYLLENPVRAGLTVRPADWPWRGGDLLPSIEAELPWV